MKKMQTCSDVHRQQGKFDCYTTNFIFRKQIEDSPILGKYLDVQIKGITTQVDIKKDGVTQETE